MAGLIVIWKMMAVMRAWNNFKMGSVIVLIAPLPINDIQTEQARKIIQYGGPDDKAESQE